VARTPITPIVPTLAGVAANPIAVDASVAPNGMTIVGVTARTVLRVITTGTIIAVTIKSSTVIGGLALADQAAVNTPATGTTWFGPFPAHLIQAPQVTVSGTPEVWLNFSVITGGTVEAITPGT
jgi:hypothetical protein